jgi:hypothetical protein
MDAAHTPLFQDDILLPTNVLRPFQICGGSNVLAAAFLDGSVSFLVERCPLLSGYHEPLSFILR